LGGGKVPAEKGKLQLGGHEQASNTYCRLKGGKPKGKNGAATVNCTIGGNGNLGHFNGRMPGNHGKKTGNPFQWPGE